MNQHFKETIGWHTKLRIAFKLVNPEHCGSSIVKYLFKDFTRTQKKFVLYFAGLSSAK